MSGESKIYLKEDLLSDEDKSDENEILIHVHNDEDDGNVVVDHVRRSLGSLSIASEHSITSPIISRVTARVRVDSFDLRYNEANVAPPVDSDKLKTWSLSTKKLAPDSELLTEMNMMYIHYCKVFNTEIDTDISIALQCGVTLLRLCDAFKRESLLPLGEVLKHDTTIRILDFKKTCIYSSGCYVLQNVLKHNKTIEVINLHSNVIGDNGVRALADGLRHNINLKTLILRQNKMSGIGLEHLIAAVKVSPSLIHIDVSNNTIGLYAVHKVKELQKSLSRDIKVDTQGTQPLAEIMNSVTHGIGMILAIVGGVILMVASYGIERKFAAVTVYFFSLLIMFICSTLCHAFFPMRRAQNVFSKLDYSSIYLLIAGTYTPFMRVNLGDIWVGNTVTYVVWILAFIGMYIGLSGDPRLQKFQLPLYLIMGWSIVMVFNYMMECVQPYGLYWIIAGGVTYTLGVPFYVMGERYPMRHAIWHVFVLLAAAFHFFAIYLYVQPMSYDPSAEKGFRCVATQNATRPEWMIGSHDFW